MDTSALIDQFRSKLKLKSFAAKSDFSQKHPHAKSFFDNHNLDLSYLRQHSSKLLAAGALGGTLFLSSGQVYAQSLPLPEPIVKALTATNSPSLEDTEEWLSLNLKKYLPIISNAFNPPFLNLQEEKYLAKIIERATGIKAVATLEGEHLNTTYGYIGAEQHLRRWPGDSIDLHGELASVEGMAPGNGGFGYFANGLQDKEGIEQEKYYVAVQTLYLPDWNKRLRYLVNWYKFRKIIVVNPDNGRAVVAVVGDAGPAAWTGKHFGGSPEVMHELGGKRYKKGRVMLLFVDDPQNIVPLGPVDYKNKLPTDRIDLTNLFSIKKEEI